MHYDFTLRKGKLGMREVIAFCFGALACFIAVMSAFHNDEIACERKWDVADCRLNPSLFVPVSPWD